MGDLAAFLVFALAFALPSAFVGYRHGSWKGRQAGRRDILERLPSADALAILQGVDRSAVVVDPLAGAADASSAARVQEARRGGSPAPLAGVGGVSSSLSAGGGPDDSGALDRLAVLRHEIESGRAVPMLTDPSGGTGARPYAPGRPRTVDEYLEHAVISEWALMESDGLSRIEHDREVVLARRVAKRLYDRFVAVSQTTLGPDTPKP